MRQEKTDLNLLWLRFLQKMQMMYIMYSTAVNSLYSGRCKNPELAKEFLRFLYSDESVSAFAEASGALYATKSAREVAKDKLSTAIYNMYGIYEEANASSLIMSFAAVPADCKINPKDEIFNPITSVMNNEMTVEEWAQSVKMLSHRFVRHGNCKLSKKGCGTKYAAAFFTQNDIRIPFCKRCSGNKEVIKSGKKTKIIL